MVTMKQVIGLWGVNYQHVAEFLGYKHKSTIEKRIKNNDWRMHEITAILQQVSEMTGITIDKNLIQP